MLSDAPSPASRPSADSPLGLRATRWTSFPLGQGPWVPVRVRRPWLVTLVAAGIAHVAALLLGNVGGDRFPYLTYFAAVLVSSWCGGFWPGLLATALSVTAVVAPWLLTGPLPPGQALGSVGFVTTGVVTSALCENLLRLVERERDARQLAEEREFERARAEHAVEEGVRRFRALIEKAMDVIVIVDRHARLTFVSPAVRTVCGHAPEDLVARSPVDLVHPADLPRCRRAFLRLRRRPGASQVMQFRYRHGNGSWCWCEGTWTSLLDDPAVGGIVANLTDVTERKRLEDEQERRLRREAEARVEAEANNRLKDEFLAVVSHELRTPLNAILGWAHVGLQQDDKRVAALETVVRNARRQARLVDDLLDLARIVVSEQGLTRAVVDFAEVVHAAVEVVTPDAAEQGVSIQLAPLRTAKVIGDGARLQQVVWNLLSNAVKFTPRGGHIDVRLQLDADNAILEVQDTGEGIAPELLPHVFDRFRQSGPSRRRGGLGLGLTISRHLVEAHGGRIDVTSDGPDQGATFTVTLPRTQALEPGRTWRAEDTPVPAAPDLTGLAVLVVEDDPDTHEFVMRVLADAGATVKGAESAPQALEIVEGQSFDALLIDIGLPGEDGLSLLSHIRALGSSAARIPAAAITAHASAADRLQARAAGFDLHLSKPVHIGTMLRAVRHLADLRKPADETVG